MTKMCENCGYVGGFPTERQSHSRWLLDKGGRLNKEPCGPLRPYVLDRNRPLSHGALAPGAKP